MNRPDRILVVGLDGGTFDLLAPLRDAGLMPNLRHLMRDGAGGVLNSTSPPITPVAWTTFMTGCRPLCHGVVDFRRLDADARHLVLNSSRSIRCPTIFDWLRRAGGRAVSINLPMTYPPRWPGSLVIGGVDSPSTARALEAEAEFARRLLERVPDFTVQAVWRQRPPDRTALFDGLKRTGASFRARVEAARVADELCDWRLMVVQFQELDGLQHRVWEVLSLAAQSGATTPEIDAARKTMTVLDDCLGELIDLAGRHRAAVCVVSDHGFGTFEGTVSTNSLLRDAGLVQGFRGPRVAAHAIGQSGGRLHKWLYRRRQPGERSTVLRRRITSQFPFDWRRTLAWSPQGDLGALVYVNSRRRFGRGPVCTERQREDVLAQLHACFDQARHPQTGRPLFSEIIDVAQRIARDPIDNQLPDLMAIPGPGIHTETKHRKGHWFARPTSLTGTHRREGIWILYGPGIRRGTWQSAAIEDVAPTLMALLDVPHDGHGQGSVLNDAITLEVPSQDRPIEHQAVTPSSWTYSAEEQAQIEQRLEGLGYLG